MLWDSTKHFRRYLVEGISKWWLHQFSHHYACHFLLCGLGPWWGLKAGVGGNDHAMNHNCSFPYSFSSIGRFLSFVTTYTISSSATLCVGNGILFMILTILLPFATFHTGHWIRNHHDLLGPPECEALYQPWVCHSSCCVCTEVGVVNGSEWSGAGCNLSIPPSLGIRFLK